VRQCIEDFLEAGVKISEVVHDDKASVDSILAEYGIKSFKDLWHKCKKLCVKFKEDLAKAKRAWLSKVEDARCLVNLKNATVRVLKEYLKANSWPSLATKRFLCREFGLIYTKRKRWLWMRCTASEISRG
jgi:hypothetical protein